jgi:transcriptional regulator with XRE-family HTH domain
MPNLSRALVRIRVLLAMSQVKFAETIGYTSANIQYVEAGKIKASARLLDAIQKRWGVDLYVYAWAIDRQERFGIEIVAAMESAVVARRAA